MSKAKKVLSVLLSLVMIFGVFSIVASAENTAIDEISFDFNIEEGMKIGDYEEYVTFATGNVEFDDENGKNAVYVYLDGEEIGYDEAFEPDKTYKINVYLTPSEGYVYDTSVEYVTVNGESITNIAFDEYTADEKTVQYLYVGGIEVYVENFPSNGIIDTAEIAIDNDLAGIDTDDYESYITILTEGLEFEDNYGDPGVFVFKGFEEYEGEFEEGETYTVRVCLSAKDEYDIADEVSGKVNGYDTEAYIYYWAPDGEIYGDLVVEYIEIEFIIIVGEEFTPDLNGKLINSAEILFDTNIAGKPIEAYEEYIEIITENLNFEDNYEDLAVYVYDSEGYDYYGNFKSGETYYITAFFSAEDGYMLANNISGKVNGEDVFTWRGSWQPDEEIYGEGVVVDYVALEFEITVDGEKEKPGFFDGIIQFFRNMYVKMLLIFLLLFVV